MEHKRVKILSIGINDNQLEGHVYSFYKQLPESLFNKRIVVRDTLYRNRGISFFDVSGFWGKRFIARAVYFFGLLLTVVQNRVFFKKDANHKEYCFFSQPTFFSARRILKKNKGFVPDVITIHWVSGFISAKTIKRLYDITKAKIVFVFVDEAHLAGGCHYSCGCNGWKKECENCPALVKGKNLAHKQLYQKIQLLRDIPKAVIATRYNYEMISQSPYLNNAYYIQSAVIPEVMRFSQQDAKNFFGIDREHFVIMLGANGLNDVRKGIKYCIEAISKFAKSHDNVVVLALGRVDDASALCFDGVQTIYTGFLGKEDMFRAYCAADVFLSTTIADSGPMMVNYSIALGTPVVSFNVGIAQDLVIHKQTGYISKYKDSDDVKAGLDYIYSQRKDFFAQKCANVVDEIQKIPTKAEQVYCFAISKGN